MIKVFITDDHQLFGEGIQTLLKETTHIHVVGLALNGNDLISQLQTTNADIVLMDISMPDMNGMEATALITERYPEVKVIALSMHNQVSHIVKMLQAGAKGYLLKHIGKEELIKAIETVHGGDIYYSSEVAVNLVNRMFKAGANESFEQEKLTQREIDVVKLIVKGHTNKEIADKLYISEATVKTHRQRIMHKLKLKHTADLIKYAYVHHIADPLD